MASARDVYQRLKDASLGVVVAHLHDHQRWRDVHSGLVAVEIDGWIVTLNKEAGALDYCAGCLLPDGQQLDSRAWAGRGTDPLELLSVWERARLEQTLAQL
ncbi:DUF7693 family protein [Halopseudomonas salegens]|uniref:DUF7693 domain-containing protein n=1 Tax=Halopseudomonas salegens TaxID=1434072 RepID=A0A1H2F9G1_9GAMM|nr:hypothetical protein [Halopseudomonas salegens]SDU03952.1 hypothetical protein SAMN05216210_1390 [Halopseudomonas salegens]